MNNSFSFTRLKKLICMNIKLNLRSICITSLAIILFLTFFPFISASSETSYFLVLYIGGFIVTSRIFNDLHNPQSAAAFLMLPCSNEEKFLSKWFISSIGYALGTLALFYVYSVLIAIPGIFMFKHTLHITHATLWVGIAKYIILQSIVLLGAISFRSYSLIKTMLACGLFLLVLSIFSVMIGYIAFFPGHILQGITLLEASANSWYFLFWITLAPVLWYVTYLRLTEYELR